MNDWCTEPFANSIAAFGGGGGGAPLAPHERYLCIGGFAAVMAAVALIHALFPGAFSPGHRMARVMADYGRTTFRSIYCFFGVILAGIAAYNLWRAVAVWP
jgi:hypothetical protein